jgi:hypothetical protein
MMVKAGLLEVYGISNILHGCGVIPLLAENLRCCEENFLAGHKPSIVPYRPVGSLRIANFFLLVKQDFYDQAFRSWV